MKNEVLVRQEKIALMLTLYRIPGTIASFIAAMASDYMVLWMEFIENLSVLLSSLILFIISKKLQKNLKFKFNYGTGKVEAISALSCEMFDMAGLFCVVFFSVRKLIEREQEEEFLVFALIVSIIGVLIDIFVFFREKELSKKEHSRMLHTAYIGAQKEFGFDLVSILTLAISLVFSKESWIYYFPPIVCIIMAIPFSIIIYGHIREAFMELADLTIDEESQLKIVKVLNEFYDSYELLGDVNSRVNGKYKHIDIGLHFRPDMTYDEVRTVSEQMKHRITEEIGDCRININVM